MFDSTTLPFISYAIQRYLASHTPYGSIAGDFGTGIFSTLIRRFLQPERAAQGNKHDIQDRDDGKQVEFASGCLI